MRAVLGRRAKKTSATTFKVSQRTHAAWHGGCWPAPGERLGHEGRAVATGEIRARGRGQHARCGVLVFYPFPRIREQKASWTLSSGGTSNHPLTLLLHRASQHCRLLCPCCFTFLFYCIGERGSFAYKERDFCRGTFHSCLPQSLSRKELHRLPGLLSGKSWTPQPQLATEQSKLWSTVFPVNSPMAVTDSPVQAA